MLRTARLAGAALAAAALLPATPALAAGHLVTPGETLSGIAANNGLSTSALAAANGLSTEHFVVAGTTLTIPAAGTTATPAATGTSGQSTATSTSGAGLSVRWGDTLSAIAARNGVSLARLAAANGLDPARPLLAGTHLRLPAAGGAGSTAAPAATTSSAPAALGGYKVRVGDTLSDLAARSRIPMAQMAFIDGLDPKKPLLAGTVLKLRPVRRSPRRSPLQRTIVPDAPPDPTPTRLSASQIGSIAAQHGAPSSRRPRSPGRRAASTTGCWAPRPRRDAGPPRHLAVGRAT